MTERKQEMDEHTAHHPDHASMDHHTTDPNAAQEVAQHGSMHRAQATEAHHASHDSGHTGHRAHATQMDGHAGHGAHAGHSEAMFQRPFWISLLLTIPVLVYAELFQQLLGYTAPPFPGSTYVGAVLGSIIYWYGGWVFLRGAADELRERTPGMMTLVALAISTAYIYSVAVTFGFVEGMPFYWELATLVTIMLLGHWMEMRAVGSAQSALNELAKLLPDTAERIIDGRTETVPVSALRVGDVVLVRPGASIPADGTLEEGDSQVNQAMITGESRPVHKRPRDQVIAGTVNGSGSLRVRITKTGEQTALAGIMRLVAEAQTSRSRAQALADRAAYWLTFIALGVAAVTFVVWLFARGFDSFTLERVVTVLVVACPHALGLAIPLVIAISTTLSARNGILVRDFQALPGRGVQATVDGRTLQVGGPRLLESQAVSLSGDLAEQPRMWGARGQTVVYLVQDGAVKAAFALADVIRPESREAVATLKAEGVEVAMLTGDSEDVARWVADELGITTYFAQVLPEHKAAKIKELQQRGAKVAMVGDGVNDAPALAQADVGIAIGAGTDVARASAGIVLVRNDPRDIARIIHLSRASYTKMVQNLAWAVGYNAIALPLAAGVLAGIGFVLPAWVGAVLMSLSTIIVAINAQTLRGLNLQDVTPPMPTARPRTA